MAAYVSPHRSLKLFGGPLGTIRFVDGRYVAIDPKEDAWLRSHRGFGVDFFDEGGAKKNAPPPPPDPKVLMKRLEEAYEQIRELTARLAAYEAATDGEPQPAEAQAQGEGDEEAEPEPETPERRRGRRR